MKGSSRLVGKLFEQAVSRHQVGDVERAKTLYDKVVRQRPGHWGAHHNLGLILAGEGQLDEAFRHYGLALKHYPNYGEAHNSLGAALLDAGQPQKAVTHFQKAVELDPDNARALNNLGAALTAIGRAEEAVTALQRALDIDPDYASAHNNMGNALKAVARLDAAVMHLERALALNPVLADVHCNLADPLVKMGRVEDALGHYQEALYMQPDLEPAWTGKLLAMHYRTSSSPTERFRAHQAYADQFEVAPRLRVVHRRRTGKRLRIGYLSGDFRTHSVAYFIEPILREHNRERFDVVALSNVRRPDATTERLRSLVDCWEDLRPLDDDQAARRIAALGIDILVDLSGHTTDNRLQVMARRPAPIQVTYLGYPNTTGLSSVDYRLTDEWADPSDRSAYLHTERLVRIDDGFLCYQPAADAPEVSALPCLERGAITFGSFNNLAKISPATIDLWADILGSLPEAHLMLKSLALSEPSVQRDVRGRFGERGVDPSRLLLYGFARRPTDHLAFYRRVDIALDTFPYNGTTTTCEALYMGVPVVTLAGAAHLSRVGVSLLEQVGLSQLITATGAEYTLAAVDLARRTDELGQLRASLRDQLLRSSLCDAPAHTRRIEAAYERMWEESGAETISTPVTGEVIVETSRTSVKS